MSLVRLLTVGDELEAEMVCALLRTEQIPATHRRTDFAAGAGDASTTAAGPREILVPTEAVAAARAVLSGTPLETGE